VQIFFEPFLSSWEDTWKVSKDAEFSGSWRHEAHGTGSSEDKGLVVGDPARKHAVSTIFSNAVDPRNKGLVLQYELQLKNGLQCGGAYIKLLTASESLSHDGFKAETPYTIMFGPDKCGETNKVHFILRHQNPISKEWEEKHLVTPPVPDTVDKLTHLYTAIVGADNSVKILVDNVEKKTASLLSDTDFKPAVNPPTEIDDPEDKKPGSWVDEPKMDEPGAAKPADWDEDAPVQIPDPTAEKPASWLDDAPAMIPDPASSVPADWDAEEDGEWEAPLIANPDCAKFGCGEWKAPIISNPDYKGKWYAPKVDNPDYIGMWAPKKIPNPNFFTDDQPHAMAPIGGIGIELWTMQDGILFDNILITSDPAVASKVAATTFVPRRAAQDATKEAAKRQAELKTEDGILGQVKYYAKSAAFYAQDNPAIVGGSVLIGLLPLILFCCMGGKKNDEDEEAEAAGPGDNEEDVDDEPAIVEQVPAAKEEPAAKDSTNKDSKAGAKKRTPKSKD